MDYRPPSFVGLAVPNRDNSANKRIHIYFSHQGIGLGPCSLYKKRDIEMLLKSIWQHFGGIVTDTFYHREYIYGFVSFKTHEQAAETLASLQDPAQVRGAVNAVVASYPAEAKKRMKHLADLIFEKGILPSWACGRR